MEADDEGLVGLNEVADMAKVSRQAVANWRTRSADFPKPVAELAAGPVFRRWSVRAWLRGKRRIRMVHVLSTINLKGGVAKTTTTVALAETLSAEFGKRVLVIDLDPQTNATTMLIGEDRWRDLNAKGRTLARLFKDAVEGKKEFDLELTLQKRVSDVGAARTVDLLPSSLDLINVQDQLATTPAGKFYSVNPTEILSRAVKKKLDEYDVVLIDCPPHLGIITLNGLRISEGYIIPTIPDYMSTYGIPQILTRVAEFSEEIGEEIEPFGIIPTVYRAQSTVHNTVLKNLKSSRDVAAAPLFNTKVKLSNQMAAAAEYSPYKRTLRQKYGAKPDGLADTFIDLARELLARLDGIEEVAA
jgi:chromosome partitioning protein